MNTEYNNADRVRALSWWNDLAAATKDAHKDKYYPGRRVETLTGRELHEMYLKEYPETQTNKPSTIEEAAQNHASIKYKLYSVNHDNAKRFFIAGAKWQKEQGFIKWYSVEKDGLPPVGDSDFDKKHGYSNQMLIYNKNIDISDFGKCLLSIKHWSHSHGNWQPTHYAYINYPDQ